MLIDRSDAVFLGDNGIGHDHPFAVQNDFAAVRLMYARQRFDKGGFARAVFAHQRMDFARLQVELHVIQRLYARKYLGDVLNLQNVF